MREIASTETVDDLIAETPLLVLQFGSEACAPCHALRAKLDVWAAAFPQVEMRYVPLETRQAEAAQHGVLGAPCVRAYADGALAADAAGYFSLDALLARYERVLELREL